MTSSPTGGGQTTTTTATSGTDALPRTGSNTSGLAILGLVLLLSGGAILLTVRRGRRAGT